MPDTVSDDMVERDLFGGRERIRAISLWQPWASAIALGHKHVETRGRPTKVRGFLAIHAAKRWDAEQREFAAVERAVGRLSTRIPLGAVVAVANLTGIRPADEAKLMVSGLERRWGNYAPGRWAWFLDNIRPLAEPIGCKGGQGFFFLPDDVADAVRAALSEPTEAV